MRPVRVLRNIAISVCTVYVVGIASAAISRHACEKHSQQENRDFLAGSVDKHSTRLARTQLQDQFEVRPPPLDQMELGYRLLARVCPLRLLTPRSWPQEAWTYALAEITPIPFVVRVDYGRYARFSYGGCGSCGMRLYLGLFGAAIPVRAWPMLMW